MTDNGNHKGLVFNIQKFSIQDGPGIRTTVFMKGCPLSCPWCSNPEGMSREQELITNDRKCIGCMKCAEVCPVNAISFVDGMRLIDWERCNNCLECAEVCPSHALEAAADHMTVDEAFRVVAQDAAFYRNSGGGITVSGGEAMLQWEFAMELFEKSKDAGFHTVLDTTAHCTWEHLEKVLEYVDLILFDIKHMDPEKHKEKTGITNELILENLEKAAKKTKVWLRIPLIPGYNDSEENLRQVAELASRIRAEKVSILPYHEYGKQKYPRLGGEYCFSGADILEPDSEAVTQSKELIESYGLDVAVGG
jgi:pyruvate formate lyase activating enzyme